MATAIDLMDIDGPSYLEPNIPCTPQGTVTAPQEAPVSSARKRTHDEFQADDITYHPLGSRVRIYRAEPETEPRRRFEGKAFKFIYKVIDAISALYNKASRTYITPVESGGNGSNKRRALAQEEATPKSTKPKQPKKHMEPSSKLPGTFPVTPEPEKAPENAAPIKPVIRHDSPMEAGPSNVAAAQNAEQTTAQNATQNANANVAQTTATNIIQTRAHKTAQDTSPLTQRNAKNNNDISPPANTTKHQAASTHQTQPKPQAPPKRQAAQKQNPAAFLAFSSAPKPEDRNKVTRDLGRPTLATLSKPPTTRNTKKDDEIDQLIKKTKNAVIGGSQRHSFQSTTRAPLRRLLDKPGYMDDFLARLDEADAKREKEKQAEEAKRNAEQKAQKEADKAKLKASADAIELQLQEEAAKQDARREEEKQQEALRKALEEKAKLSDPGFIRKQQIIHPLDPEWDDKVDEQMSTKARHHIIAKTVEGTELTRKDFGTLLPQEGTEDNPNGWLNDEIVNGWMAGIVDRKKTQTFGGNHLSAKDVPPFAAMSSAWYSNYQKGGIKTIERWSRRKGIQGQKLLKSEKIFFPINTGAHWLLLIISPKARTIELLDSLNGSARRWFSIAREWLQMELKDAYDVKEWKELPSRSSYQLNSNDCGVFTCFNALAAAKGQGFETIRGEEMDDARRLMGAVFINGGFMGDYDL